MKKLNLIGQKFSSLTVIQQVSHISNRIRWLCKCDCGGTALVTTDNLRSGNSTNCGCARVKNLTDRNTTHGLRDHELYPLWCNMRNRCTNKNNPDYYLYGAKGITVCERWNDFANFLNDMGLRPEGYSIDRIDPYGNYEPSNCRWATAKEQRANQRLPESAIRLQQID